MRVASLMIITSIMQIGLAVRHLEFLGTVFMRALGLSHLFGERLFVKFDLIMFELKHFFHGLELIQITCMEVVSGSCT